MTLAGRVYSFWQPKTHLHVLVIGSRSICISIHWWAGRAQVIFQWEWHYNQPQRLLFSCFFFLFFSPAFSHTCSQFRGLQNSTIKTRGRENSLRTRRNSGQRDFFLAPQAHGWTLHWGKQGQTGGRLLAWLSFLVEKLEACITTSAWVWA